MVIEIALGIVLAAILLALFPVAIWAGIGAAKMVPLLLFFALAGLLLVGVARLLGGPAFVLLAALLAVLWFQAPKLWALKGSRLGQWAQRAYATFMALLDKKPPYDGTEWLLARMLIKLVAMLGAVGLVMSVLAVVYHSFLAAWPAVAGL